MSNSRRRPVLLAATVALGIAASTTPATAAPTTRAPAITTLAVDGALTPPGAGPFTEPAFASTCTWHRYDEGQRPPWWTAFIDPLCVEYSKRDITLDNGGALRFLLAEPSRIGISLMTCHYYQRDHWSVQSTSGTTPWIAWDGQYWWDKAARQAGIRLTNFRIDGVRVGIGDAAIALHPLFPALANALAAYGSTSGESGLTTTLPLDLACAPVG